MKTEIMAGILNPKNIGERCIKAILNTVDDKFCQWSGLKSFQKTMNENIGSKLCKQPVNYQLFYKKRLVYYGMSDSTSHHISSGGYDRLRKYRADLHNFTKNKDENKITQSCLKLAHKKGWSLDPKDWGFRYLILPRGVSGMFETTVIDDLKKNGMCDLNQRYGRIKFKQ